MLYLLRHFIIVL